MVWKDKTGARISSFIILNNKVFKEIMNELIKTETTHIFSDSEINNCSK